MLTRLLSTARGLNRRSRRWPPRATDQSGPSWAECDCGRIVFADEWGRLICKCGMQL